MEGPSPPPPLPPSPPEEEEGRSGALAWAGRLGGPVLAVAAWWLLPGGPGGLSPEGRFVAATGVLMAVWWVTEALPLPATALLPLVLFPAGGVFSVDAAAAPYADPVIFLFLGGFVLALAMERWGLHRRIALRTVLAVGTKPPQLVGGFMAATAFLSMWMSNTATTVMMLPIGVSIIALVLDRLREEEHPFAFDALGRPRPVTGQGSLRFATCLMLGIAYAASIGGLATLIGTPPNAILAGFLRANHGIEIGFGRWMLFAAPLSAVLLVVAWLLLVFVLYPTKIRELPGGRELVRGELDALGPMGRGERAVLVVFAATAAAWVFREPLAGVPWLVDHLPFVGRLSDPAIAVLAALVLFALPVDARRGVFVMDWKTAVRLPWGVLLLFGGGLSLATAVRASGVDAWIGQGVGGLAGVPPFLLVLAVATVVLFLTELTSNTATAATFLPVLAGAAAGIGADTMLLAVPAALAASCAFMMPVATPPNAIVFGSGHVTIAQMVKAGFWLNCLAAAAVTASTFLLGRLVLGIQ